MITTQNGIWDTVMEAWPGTEVRNKELAAQSPIHVLVTLCPLYAKGDLGASELMSTDTASIAESRVGGKWDALKSVLGAAAVYAEAHEITLAVTAVFANRGVLLAGYSDSDNRDMNDKNLAKLKRHEVLYRQALTTFLAEHGISGTFLSYDDLDVKLPSFVNPSAHIPGADIDAVDSITDKTVEVIRTLNVACAEAGVPTQLDIASKPTKKIIRQLVSAFGAETAYWLTLGYLAFDYRMPELVGENGVAVYAERFPTLFAIGDLTPEVSSMSRVEVLA